MFFSSKNIIESWRSTPHCRVSSSSKLVFSGYLGHEWYSQTIRDINRLIDPGAECSYVMQDEMVTYGLVVQGDENDLVYDSASGKMIAPLTFAHQEMIHAVMNAYCFFDTNQWRAWMSHATFSLQRRFHGSMIALQSGVPSLMIALDDRMKEMLNFIGFPYIELDSWIDAPNKRDYLNSFLESIKADVITDRYSERQSAFRISLKEAGLSK